MKHIYIAGNWKMNKDINEAVEFIETIQKEYQTPLPDDVIPIIIPPSLYLDRFMTLLTGSSVRIGAQDISKYDSGAYTGEISAGMLHSLDIPYSLAGHSERRQYHNETNQDVNIKAKNMIATNITPIICVGELDNEREIGITNDVILQQLNECMNGIESSSDFIIAYEPVWAIGTGKTATPEIAQEVHALIRNWLTDNYGTEKAAHTSILYGGSIKTSNFASLLAEEDIDGGLIGGASLDAASFIELVRIGLEANRK